LKKSKSPVETQKGKEEVKLGVFNGFVFLL